MLFITSSFTSSLLFGQETTVQKIEVNGLKRTSKDILIRDLPITIGQQIKYSEVDDEMRRSSYVLMNTGIYASIVCKLVYDKTDSCNSVLRIQALEAWHIYPIPYAELVDRNFNVWAKERHYDFHRINLGMNIYLNNFTGHRDRMEVHFQFGYNDKVSLEYRYPYINKAKNIGLIAFSEWSHNEELPYKTNFENIELRWLSDSNLISKFKTRIALVYQPHYYTQQKIQLEWRQLTINSAIVPTLNSEFLNTKNGTLSYPILSYSFLKDKRNIRPHPTKGYWFSAIIEQHGYDKLRNATVVNLQGRYFKQILPKVTWASFGEVNTTLQHNKIDYYHNRALGIGDTYLRGYEYYLIDGIHYTMVKNSLQFLVHDKIWNLSKIAPVEALKRPTVQIYITANFDVGYVPATKSFKKDQFNNTALPGGGIGIEIVAFYDKMIQLEYSFNKLWENDLFLHFNFGF